MQSIKEARVSQALAHVPEAFFREAEVVYQRASAAAPEPLKLQVKIAGLSVVFHYLGEAVIAKIRPAFRHLEVALTAGSKPDLDIHLWEDAGDEPLVPRPHPVMRQFCEKHVLALCTDRRFKAFDEDWLGTRTWIDVEQGVAFYSLSRVESLPYYESAAPLRALFNAFLNRHQRQMVHGAAVGNARGGLLLAGQAGSGKSSTALRCLDSTLFYLADDWCVISTGEKPAFSSIYNSAKLRPDNLERFASFVPLIHNRDKLDEEKATFFLQDHFPEKLLPSCPARAILLPCVTGSRTRLEQAPGKEAWKALVPCSLSQIPGSGRESVALMSALAAQIPAYRLLLGSDMDAIPPLLINLLEELSL